MTTSAKNVVTGAARAVGGVANTVSRTLTGRSASDRSEAAQKAAATRRQQAAKRSRAAKKGAETRQASAAQRSAAAKKAARTRRQRDARVQAMVDATRRD